MTAAPGERDYRHLLKEALVELKTLRAELEEAKQHSSEPIAILGMGCRLPGGVETPNGFWELLERGGDAIREVPPERWDADKSFASEPFSPEMIHTKWGGYLDQLDQFDPGFFALSQGEAAGMDPQQRLLMEVAWESLENAAIPPDCLAGTQTAVIVGISNMCDYYQSMLHPPKRSGTGVANCVAANRLSYFLDLQGPSLVVDTACSSSLVGLHLACQSLRSGECDMALAGGVNAIVSPRWMISFSMAGMLAEDGRCKPFDAAADGFVRSEGCVVLVLKRLADALADGNRIQAVIRGSAVNQDGRSSALTVPNGLAMQRAIRQGLETAQVKPGDIRFFEAHGLGSEMGDSIEMGAIVSVLSEGRGKDERCLIGSAKANIGHTEPVSGLVGVLKTVLALQKGNVPAQIHLKTLNPNFDLSGTAFEIPLQAQPWPDSGARRVAAVNSFGIGGTNAFAVLESAPEPETVEGQIGPSWSLLALSAQDETALLALAARYADYLRTNPDCSVERLCFTAAAGRAHFTTRLAVVADTRDSFLSQLVSGTSESKCDGWHWGCRLEPDPPRMGFWIPDTSPADAELGRALYPVLKKFSQEIDRCDGLVQDQLPMSLRSGLDASRAGNVSGGDSASVLALSVAVALACAEQLIEWGIAPGAVAGQGTGEYAAAVMAGALSREDAFRLAIARGRVADGLLSEAGFREAVQTIQTTAPRRTWVSSITGTVVTGKRTLDGADWSKQGKGSVDPSGLHELLAEKGFDHRVCLGPSSSPKSGKVQWFHPFAPGPSVHRGLAEGLADLYVHGVRIDWGRVDFGTSETLILPTYPFQRVRCWLDETDLDPSSRCCE